MNDHTIKQRDQAFVARTYDRFGAALEKGCGAHLTGFDGKDYIDFSSGIGVNSLGCGEDGWVEAVTRQVKTLAHTSNLYYTAPCGELAQMLCERSFARKVFFANSGAEANECAIKAARKYADDKYPGQDRNEIVSLTNSFHGRTVTTLSATGQDTFHQHFAPFTGGFVFAPAGDFAQTCAMITEKTCAVMFELVQGEGGVVALDPHYVKQLCDFCHARDILVIIDEVQTGVGRTGKLFCYEHYGVTPDIVTLAKGLGGGLPIGAALLGERCGDTLGFGDHGSTFGGNPICCAGGVQVLKTIDETFLAQVRSMGELIARTLEAHQAVQSVSGLGMMVGVSLKDGLSSKAVVAKAVEEGLLVLTAKTKVRLLPPLNIPQEDLNKGLSILCSVIDVCMKAQQAQQ